MPSTPLRSAGHYRVLRAAHEATVVHATRPTFGVGLGFGGGVGGFYGMGGGGYLLLHHGGGLCYGDDYRRAIVGGGKGHRCLKFWGSGGRQPRFGV